MSRIGKKPVILPKGVTCQVGQGQVEIKGPKGALKAPVPSGVSVKTDGGNVVVERSSEEKAVKAKHGMVRSIIHNAVVGVTDGWKKDLEIVGIGYKAILEGGKDEAKVAFSLGYSHVLDFPVPKGIQIAIDKQTRLTITGMDRQQVGQVAAEIRALRPPEPYKGKGIKYTDEVIKKKVGKTGA